MDSLHIPRSVVDALPISRTLAMMKLSAGVTMPISTTGGRHAHDVADWLFIDEDSALGRVAADNSVWLDLHRPATQTTKRIVVNGRALLIVSTQSAQEMFERTMIEHRLRV